MNPEETMVEENFDDEAMDEALPEEIVEDDEDESEEEDLESVIGDEGTEEEDAEEQPQQVQKANEPGYVKKRVTEAVEKAVAKAIADTEARMQAMFDQQMAPFKAKMLEEEAQELVRSRKVSDIETARELVRLRNGQPAQTAEQPTQPMRNDQGRFASKADVETSARIDMLKHQADSIRAKGGPDVIKEFQNNEEIKQKVIAGEMDFHDVADYLREQKASRKRPPSPMRSPNGASGTNPNAIDSMSDEQFAKLEKRIQEGARIRLR